MRSASAAFMRALGEGRRDYVVKIYITLTDNTVIHGTQTTYDYDTGDETVADVAYLTGENIMLGGLSIEDSVSEDDVFQIGGAIINQATIIINNTDEQYTEYDFLGADVAIYVGLTNLDNGQDEYIKMGVFIVSESDYDESRITLTCLDYMFKFDKLHKTYGNYNDGMTSFSDVLLDCCTKCGVTPDSSLSTFYGNDLIINTVPSDSELTFRQVVSWIAQITGNFTRCDVDGKLCIGFYNFHALMQGLDGGSFDSSTPYSTGDTADGGSFNPWNTGYVADGNSADIVHVISSYFSSKMAASDTVVTGVSVEGNVTGYPSTIPAYSNSQTYVSGDYVRVNSTVYQCIVDTAGPETFNDAHWSQTSSVTYMYGNDSGYVVDVSGNGFIDVDYVEPYAQEIASRVANVTFRAGNISHTSDPTIEAGDVALFCDNRGRCFHIIVSSTTFNIDDNQTTVSSGEKKRYWVIQ